MKSFLQSREWAEIQERDGRSAHRLKFDDEECWFFKHRLPFGFYYCYAPRPIIRDAQAFGEAAVKLGKESGAVFFRVEPGSEFRIQDSGFRVQDSGFGIQDSGPRVVSAPNLQPLETIIIDLAKSNEELLAAMHPKTRYNLRLAEKHGALVEDRTGVDAVQDFYELLARTSKRDGFSLHPKSHYANLLFSYSHELENRLFMALYRGKIAAAAIVNFYGGTATYLHGASDYSLRHLMAPYLLHWKIIQAAKSRGCQTYDLWGIDETRWPGVTRFKIGFGGGRQAFPAAFDIVLQPFWYGIYQVIRRLHP